MPKDKTIQVKCIGTESISLEKLTPYNVRLKDRRDKDIASLARKIIDKGFSFPLFVWQRPDTNQNLILDGNGRYLALQWLQKKKYTIPAAIPVIRIEAADELQARKKVLEINNLNGKFSQDALLLFVEGLQIDMSDYTIPNIDYEILKAIQPKQVGFFPPVTSGEEGESPESQGKSVKVEKPAKVVPTIGGTGEWKTTAVCPHCGKIHDIFY